MNKNEQAKRLAHFLYLSDREKYSIGSLSFCFSAIVSICIYEKVRFIEFEKLL